MRLALLAIAIVGCAAPARLPPRSTPAPPTVSDTIEGAPASSLAEWATELALSIEVGTLRDDASPSAEIFIFNRGGRTWDVPRVPADGLLDLAIRVRDADHPDDPLPMEPTSLRETCGPVLLGGPVSIAPGKRVALGCIATRADVHAIEALLVDGTFSFRAKDGSAITLTAKEREAVRRPLAKVRARARQRAKPKDPKSLLDLVDVAIENHVPFALAIDPRALRVELLGEQGFIEDSLQMFAPRVIAQNTCANDALCALLAASWQKAHPNDPGRPVFDPNDLAPVVVPAQSTMPLPPRGTFGPAWEGRLPRLFETPIRAVLEVVVDGRAHVFTSSWVQLSGT